VFEPSEEAKLNVLIYVKKKVATERFSPASTEGKVREKGWQGPLKKLSRGQGAFAHKTAFRSQGISPLQEDGIIRL